VLVSHLTSKVQKACSDKDEDHQGESHVYVHRWCIFFKKKKKKKKKFKLAHETSATN
jgi:hypothetical protein